MEGERKRRRKARLLFAALNVPLCFHSDKKERQPDSLKLGSFVCSLAQLVVCIVRRRLRKRQFIPFYVFLEVLEMRVNFLFEVSSIFQIRIKYKSL